MEHPEVAQVLKQFYAQVASREPYLNVPPPDIHVLSGEQADREIGETTAEVYNRVTHILKTRLDAVCFGGLLHEFYHHADFMRDRFDALLAEWGSKIPVPPGFPEPPFVYIYEVSTDIRSEQLRERLRPLWIPIEKRLISLGAEIIAED